MEFESKGGPYRKILKNHTDKATGSVQAFYLLMAAYEYAKYRVINDGTRRYNNVLRKNCNKENDNK